MNRRAAFFTSKYKGIAYEKTPGAGPEGYVRCFLIGFPTHLDDLSNGDWIICPPVHRPCRKNPEMAGVSSP